jgi:hypothetical protein
MFFNYQPCFIFEGMSILSLVEVFEIVFKLTSTLVSKRNVRLKNSTQNGVNQ